MHSREVFIEKLLNNLSQMVTDLEDMEADDSDFSTAREMAEQLQVEIEELQVS